jgi:hypothetical protein
MKARTALIPAASVALVLGSAAIGSASTHTTAATTVAGQVKAPLATSSPALATCFPHTKARVTVALNTDSNGKDGFTISASGLRPKTDFTVFLLEQAGAPFGAAEYIGDFTTDRSGRATNTYKLIVEEAFAFNNVTHARTDLNSIGVWFADPKDDDGCLGDTSPVTGFDGDAEAGVQMMNSGIAVLP